MMAVPVKPKALQKGGTIGVAALSGPVDEGKLEAGVARLRAKGYRVVEAANLRRRAGLFAGTDEDRAAGYLGLVRNTEVDAVFFARGGYGAARVLPLLSATAVRSHPKIHLGGSDLTALFAWLGREAGLVTFYGPMVAVEIPAEDGLDWEAVLAGALPPEHRFAPEDVLSPGRAEGPIVGGCLSLLASLAGTPQALSAEGCVLFWEDVGEPAYRLDRMITQLEQAGTFDRLQGMVIGSLGPREGDAPDALQAWAAERFRGAPFPVAMNLPGGHLSRPRTLPLNVRVVLTAGSESALVYSEPGVELR